MPYEVVDPADRQERGLFYPTFEDAVEHAHVTFEIWQIADDDWRSRMVMVWPDAEFQPRVSLAPGTLANVVPITKGHPERWATAMLEEYPVATREQIIALVALAYSTGNRDGYAECAADNERILLSMGRRRTS